MMTQRTRELLQRPLIDLVYEMESKSKKAIKLLRKKRKIESKLNPLIKEIEELHIAYDTFFDSKAVEVIKDGE